MQHQDVIHWKNLPSRWPIVHTALTWLLLDRFHAAGWIKGVAWTLIGILWIASIVGHSVEDYVTLDEIEKRSKR